MRTGLYFAIAILFCFSCVRKDRFTESAAFGIGVYDQVGLLNDEQKRSLSVLIDSVQDIGPELAVFIIDTLNGEPIETVSINKARSLRLGRADFNDGLLITISTKDRAVRIEVGTGLETIISDEIAAEIIRNDIVPAYRLEKYYEGLHSAITSIKHLLRENSAAIGKDLE